jgi:hypothetical protein
MDALQRNRRQNRLLNEIGEQDRKLAEHRMLAGIHLGTPAMRVAMSLAEVTYGHREAARRELAGLRSGDHVVAP